MVNAALFMISLAVFANAVAEPNPTVIGSYDTGYSEGAEILSVQQKSMRAALTIGAKGQVDILSLRNPSKPSRLNRIDVLSDSDADISSVAFHPTENYIAVAIIHKDPWKRGRVELYNPTSGQKLLTVQAGYWPDSVLFSRDGRWLAVANEGEPFTYDSKNQTYVTPHGSATLIDLQRGIDGARVTQIQLPDLTGTPGIVGKNDKRFFEREVNVSGSGMETVEIAIQSASPDVLEPEYLAFGPDNRELFVALQENNAVIVVDVTSGQVSRSFGLGVSSHKADLREDGDVRFSDTLTAYREPDGIALSTDGSLLLTADEGDTEPKASKVERGYPTGGSRTLSVFDAATGKFLGDTGNQLDAMAHAVGVYPEDRSDNKGSEPESVVYAEMDGIAHAAVTLERADAIALINLSNPAAPRVVSVTPLRQSGDTVKAFAPEGLALFRDEAGNQYLLCANEKSGTVTVVKL